MDNIEYQCCKRNRQEWHQSKQNESNAMVFRYYNVHTISYYINTYMFNFCVMKLYRLIRMFMKRYFHLW